MARGEIFRFPDGPWLGVGSVLFRYTVPDPILFTYSLDPCFLLNRRIYWHTSPLPRLNMSALASECGDYLLNSLFLQFGDIPTCNVVRIDSGLFEEDAFFSCSKGAMDSEVLALRVQRTAKFLRRSELSSFQQFFAIRAFRGLLLNRTSL